MDFCIIRKSHKIITRFVKSKKKKRRRTYAYIPISRQYAQKTS